MGQHKHNPTAILAKEGKLPPKEPKMGKPERRRFLREMMRQELIKMAMESKAQPKEAEGQPEETEDKAGAAE